MKEKKSLPRQMAEKWCAAFIGLLVLWLIPAPLCAQSASTRGRVEGTVLDSSGAVVPQAKVTVRNEDTGVSAMQETDADGHFEFLYLDPGRYEVSIEKAGFGALHMKEISVAVGTTVTLQPHLTVGQVTTSVTVSAAAQLVDTTQSSLATVVGPQAMESLPLNGRNFTDFVLLTPGATTDGDFGMISFNGIAGNFNNYTVDGGNNNNAFFAQQIGRTSIPYQFSEDVIQEFQVNSTGYQAEFGQAGGGVVNTVTKSGTNVLHGDGYYYVLDSALNANDTINNSQGIPKPHNRRQQFGGTVGGPIQHNRLFYLANYEGQVRNEPLTVNDAPALVGLPPNFFANNPALAAQVMSSAGSFPRSFNQNVVFFKLSGMLNKKNTFAATYNYQRYRSPHGYFNTPTSTGDSLSLTDGSTSHFFQFYLQTTFSPATINEAWFHFGTDHPFDLPPSPTSLPTVTIQSPDTGFVFGGNRFQQFDASHRYEAADNLTRVLGRHIFKAGVDINVIHIQDYFQYAPKGEYRFASLPDVATGNFELYLQSFGQNTATIVSPTYSFFAQDQFRATSRLTLNYGLRYDLQVLPQPNPCNPAYTATCHVPYSKNNLAPRVGFAYSLDPSGRTVLRGSFGLFYMQEDLLDMSHAFLSNGVSQPFLVATGPAFGNSNPLVTYPNSLTSFPSGAGGTPSITIFAPDFRSPYVEQANLQVEHQFGGHTSLSAGYVYSHGLALLGNSNGVTRQATSFGLDLNLVPPAQQPNFGGSFSTAQVTLPNGKVYTSPDYSAIDGFLNPNFGAINSVDNSGHSLYNALVVSFKHSSTQFFSSIAYTLSKTIDQGTGYYNQFDQQAERGPSQLDQRNRFVMTGAWMPQFRALRNFTLSGVLNLASGRPYTGLFDNPEINFSVVPGEGFNSFTGPDVRDFDFGVARLFHLTEHYELQLKAEAFDLFNHPNYQQNVVDAIQYTTQSAGSNGTTSLWTATANPNFGQPLATVPKFGSRAFQFSTRFSF